MWESPFCTLLSRSMVALCLGLRVVRGPDWCWGDQDGGEGFVGTVVEVEEGGRSAVVQWDAGTKERYRCGDENKFDLRVFDAAPTGMQFPDVFCSGCYVEGVAGIHWQCAHCYEYHLCHSCYLLGRHCQEHPFFRVESKEQAARVKVSCRAGAKRVEAKGVFVGADVVRGPHWRFGDQDGGAGMTGRVITIEGWKTVTSRSIAKVEWSTGGTANIYRVGHMGKVDVCCTATGNGGYYYPDHLITLGLGAAVTVFDEEEIVAGDFVKVEIDPEVFKMMHEAAGLWDDNLIEILNDTAVMVLSVLENQRLCVSTIRESYVVYSNAMTKLKHCRVGQMVRVISDLSFSRLHHLHNVSDEIWNDEMFITAGQIGRVTNISIFGTVQVNIQGRGWLFSPLCLEPAPGETESSHTPDPHNESIGMVSNYTHKNWRERMKAEGFFSEMLLDGDSAALESFLCSNEIQAKRKARLLGYYAVTGMVDALRLCLKCGIDPVVFKIGDKINTCITYNQEESLVVFLLAGADINGVVGRNNKMTPLTQGAFYRNYRIVRTLASCPGVNFDAQNSYGTVAIQISSRITDHNSVAVLLSMGANPSIQSHTHESSLHRAARFGHVAVMEVHMVYAKEHLNLMNYHCATPLHLAACCGHPDICSLLAAEASVNLNIEQPETKATPLHAAVESVHWSTVECLVGWGADLNLANSVGNTPLHAVIKLSSPEVPVSPQLKQVREELSVASGGRAVEGYIAVACFLMREGADWHIKNKDGISPHKALPPGKAALIAEYLKGHPGPGMFHGSLRREQQQCKLQELPLQLEPPRPPPSLAAAAAASSSAAATAVSATVTANLSSASKDCASFMPRTTEPDVKSGFLSKAKFNKGSDGAVQPSGVSKQPCLLCEDHPASIRFSPCGHMVLCSECAQRAKSCLQCKFEAMYVESPKTVDTG